MRSMLTQKDLESDPRGYPGVNAITLLIEKGDADALKRADHWCRW